MKVFIILVLLVGLLLPHLAMAQEPENPPGLTGPDTQPEESETPSQFHPYTPTRLNVNEVTAVNVSPLKWTFTIRRCPSKYAEWCWENVKNRPLGYVPFLASIKIDAGNCVFDDAGRDYNRDGKNDGEYKWCYVPDLDPDHSDDDTTLIGWIAVCYGPGSEYEGCWFDFRDE